MKNVLFVLIVFLFTACSNERPSAAYHEKSANTGGYAVGKDKAAKNTVAAAKTYKKSESQQLPSPQKESAKILKTAHLSVQVEKYKEARYELEKIINSYDAYFSSEQESKQTFQMINNLVIRVKPEHFENVIKGIENIAIAVDKKTTSASDVSKQFVDIEARLQSKRDVVTRYRSILSKAQTIPDILNMEDKIRVIVEEIEAMEGQLRYLTSQVGMSTINLYMYERIEQPIAKAQVDGFLTKALSSVKNGWDDILDIVLGLLDVWPTLFFFLIVGYFGIKNIRRFRK